MAEQLPAIAGNEPAGHRPARRLSAGATAALTSARVPVRNSRSSSRALRSGRVQSSESLSQCEVYFFDAAGESIRHLIILENRRFGIVTDGRTLKSEQHTCRTEERRIGK